VDVPRGLVVKFSPALVVAAVGLAGAAALAWWVSRQGGIASAAQRIGAGAVGAVIDTAGGVTAGAVGAIGAQVGLPTPAQTTTDASVARWIIDNHGHWAASQWAGAPAYARAVFMDAGTGTPPAAGSPAALGLPTLASYDETDRLARRYPVQPLAEILTYELPSSQVAPYYAP
jgi:hypothetical protein